MYIVQVNDELDGESRCPHPHMNELDTNNFLRSGPGRYTLKMELPTWYL